MSRPNRSKVRLLPWLGGALLPALAGLSLATPSSAGELYQWKDAKGVTHYSDAPPPSKAAYQTRTIRDGQQAPVVAKPAESAQCMTARLNLEHLRGTSPVGLDSDGDGKPDRTLDLDQRTAQAQLAEAAIKVHCTTAVATVDPAE